MYIDLSLFMQIDSIQLMMDSETGRSKGYGFITVSCMVKLLFKMSQMLRCRISDIYLTSSWCQALEEDMIFSRAY